MKVVHFRAEATEKIGGGHVVRCSALAAKLSQLGWRCELQSSTDTFRYVPPSILDAFDVVKLPIALPDIEVSTLPSAIVFDDYSVGASEERKWANEGVLVIAIDDIGRKHSATLLVDPNATDSAASFANDCPPHAGIISGPKFALLRDEFLSYRALSLSRPRHGPRVERVLINFGLTDPHGAGFLALDALEGTGASLSVQFILGSGTHRLAELVARCKQSPLNVSVSIEPGNVAEIMASCDFAIGASGGAAWERCALGLPSILVPVADNQFGIASTLASSGAALHAGLLSTRTSRQLGEALSDVLKGRCDLSLMSRRAASLCDGRGAERVASHIDRLHGLHPTRGSERHGSLPQ